MSTTLNTYTEKSITSDTFNTDIEMDSQHSLSDTEMDVDTDLDYASQDLPLNMADTLPRAHSPDF